MDDQMMDGWMMGGGVDGWVDECADVWMGRQGDGQIDNQGNQC